MKALVISVMAVAAAFVVGMTAYAVSSYLDVQEARAAEELAEAERREAWYDHVRSLCPYDDEVKCECAFSLAKLHPIGLRDPLVVNVYNNAYRLGWCDNYEPVPDVNPNWGR